MVCNFNYTERIITKLTETCSLTILKLQTSKEVTLHYALIMSTRCVRDPLFDEERRFFDGVVSMPTLYYALLWDNSCSLIQFVQTTLSCCFLVIVVMTNNYFVSK